MLIILIKKIEIIATLYYFSAGFQIINLKDDWCSTGICNKKELFIVTCKEDRKQVGFLPNSVIRLKSVTK